MSPKKKKPAHESTTEELARRAFGKKTHEHLKKLIRESKPKKS